MKLVERTMFLEGSVCIVGIFLISLKHILLFQFSRLKFLYYEHKEHH